MRRGCGVAGINSKVLSSRNAHESFLISQKEEKQQNEVTEHSHTMLGSAAFKSCSAAQRWWLTPVILAT
jgi:hypothetical protein